MKKTAENMTETLQKCRDHLLKSDLMESSGKVMKVVGLTVESSGPDVNMGDLCRIYSSDGSRYVEAEVVGFKDQRIQLMPFGDMVGVGFGSRVVATHQVLSVPVADNLVGRVLNALGRPMDGKGDIATDVFYPVENRSPNPLSRKRIHETFPLGIRAIDGMITAGRGQRLPPAAQRARFAGLQGLFRWHDRSTTPCAAACCCREACRRRRRTSCWLPCCKWRWAHAAAGKWPGPRCT